MVIDDFHLIYDENSDVLYLSVGKPKKSDNSYLDDDYILVRENKHKIIAITIDDFLERKREHSWDDNLILKYFPAFNIYDFDKFFQYDYV